jgi:transposase
MELRLQKPKEIVAGGMVRPGPGCYFVQSQSADTRFYRVVLEGLYPHCDCEDFELTGQPCKHIFAARIFVAQQEAGGPAPCDKPSLRPKRKTYPQDWPNYNAAQVNEGYYVSRLLFDLCQTIPRTGRGRPPVPVRDGIYAACLMVYGGKSARRSNSNNEIARDNGFLTTIPHFNSVLNVLDDPATTPILVNLVRLSSLPLASIEVDFAVDSTGFSSSRYTRWFDHKYGKEVTKADWVKVHAMCGVKTNIVTAVMILEQEAADSPQLPGLVKTTSQNFEIHDVSADKAYTCTENFQAVEDLGGVLYAPFKSNTTGGVGGIFERMFHYFNLYRMEYLEHYHKRSNVESTFSAVKRKLGDSVLGKSDTSMINEVLAKLVCYNLTCCIAEWYTLGIEPVFLADAGCTNIAVPEALNVQSQGPK